MLEYRLNENIKIKMMEVRHKGKFLEFMERNKTRFIDWIPFVSKMKGIEDIERVIRTSLEKYKNGTGFLYGMWDNDLLVGVVLVREADLEAKWAEIGYMIDCSYEGKGLIKKACFRLMKYLFDEQGMEKIELCCDDENTGSYKLAERLGFILEGTLRNHIVINGKVRSMRWYGLLKNEFRYEE